MGPTTGEKEIGVKGMAFRSVLAAHLHLRGPAADEAVRKALPEALSHALVTGTLMPSGFHPVAWYRELYAAIRRTAGGSLDVVRQVGALSAERDVSTMYRMVFKLLSPKTLMQSTQRSLQTFFTDVRLVASETSPRRIQFEYQGFVGFDENLWADMYGSSERLIQMTGVKDVVLLKTGGGGNGDSTMALTCSWRA